VATRADYPVTLEGRLDARLSRWLWLVKWILAIPHYVVLFFLWIAFFVLTFIAFFAILATGRYPRGIFDFNVGVLRWTWRVGFYSYAALGTDRYPPFTLDAAPDYPATLEVSYPESLSRGLVLVKWWLLAIPHYAVVAIFAGGFGFAAWNEERWSWGFSGGLIGLVVFFAGVVLLFRGRYPLGIFDFALGMDRWVARVAAYAGLMTDEYPPFRLEQGGADPASITADEPTDGGDLVAETPATPPSGGTLGRVVLFIVGGVAALLAFGLLAGGCAIVAVDQTQRDDEGFLMSPTQDFRTSTYAIVSENAELDLAGAQWVVDSFLGTVRIRSESGRPVFVGIGPAVDVTAYLAGVEHDVVTDLEGGPFEGRPRYSHRPGGVPSAPPGEQTFWVASAAGAGEQALDWDPEDGDWRVVLMNDDATRGVDAEISIGAELDPVVWIGVGLFALGVLLAAGAALAITAGARRRGDSGDVP
jgi:Domain of unknown function (DUF4389)